MCMHAFLRVGIVQLTCVNTAQLMYEQRVTFQKRILF